MLQFHNFSTSSPVLAAQVQKPAPAFKAQAVVGGQIKEVSLEDYKVTKILSSDLCYSCIIPRVNMWWYISTPWTLPLSAPLRSSPSLTASRSSRPSTLPCSVRILVSHWSRSLYLFEAFLNKFTCFFSESLNVEPLKIIVKNFHSNLAYWIGQF